MQLHKGRYKTLDVWRPLLRLYMALKILHNFHFRCYNWTENNDFQANSAGFGRGEMLRRRLKKSETFPETPYFRFTETFYFRFPETPYFRFNLKIGQTTVQHNYGKIADFTPLFDPVRHQVATVTYEVIIIQPGRRRMGDH